MGLKRHASGYRMACKPPWTPTAEALLRFAGSACPTPRSRKCRRTCGRVARAPGTSQPVAAMLSAPCATERHCLRNAVGADGVKLEAAPEAPPRGEVPARVPPGRFPSGRRRTTSTFIGQSWEFGVCPALARGPGGRQPRLETPARHRGGGRGRQLSDWPEARWRWETQRAPAQRRADTATYAAGRTRQRAAHDRRCGRYPHPGKDPL